jgi:hypothetical protein
MAGVELFLPGRLAFSPSSLGLPQSVRVLACLATREPKSRHTRVVEGARVPRAELCMWQSGG